MSNEDIWREELTELLRDNLQNHDLEVDTRNILKDIFYFTEKDKKYLQLGLFNQDVVIYDENESLDIAGFDKLTGIKFHNIDLKTKRSGKLVVPKIILELKYIGVNTHTLITYSKISTDIKTIYPNCKYFFVMLYKGNSSHNKLLRNGTSFDKILYFNDGIGKKGNYRKGTFKRSLKSNKEISKKFDILKSWIISALEEEPIQ
jgi:hypothetical protein